MPKIIDWLKTQLLVVIEVSRNKCASNMILSFSVSSRTPSRWSGATGPRPIWTPSTSSTMSTTDHGEKGMLQIMKMEWVRKKHEKIWHRDEFSSRRITYPYTRVHMSSSPWTFMFPGNRSCRSGGTTLPPSRCPTSGTCAAEKGTLRTRQIKNHPCFNADFAAG